MSCPTLFCSDCGGDRPFEQPPCADGHGAECPERACTVCGTAVLAGAVPPAARPSASARHRAA
ncbi:hypothetical protein SAMN04489712_103204 [Thermomonospora echinospora]|uniref:Uncharacterized protein n=1 Tax=Thermomonospora echinospora TaxID=1992 RepID=A0A1H5XE61_9ACTN|nr:hypothetical protein [Thermomonospora echinospora]SEG09755.1 hypothetical protein SAMN04489712_103204 [Thermomonospora echinospora]